jgi:dimethylhistidine N-methyltransferase
MRLSPDRIMPPQQQARFIQAHTVDGPAERASALAALAAESASAAPKHFYDRLGSRLFEAITELPEYYPTRVEASIFETHAQDMALRTGIGRTLVDLGAGNCAKAARLFPLLEPKRYVAVDISVDFLRDALRQLQREHPGIEMTGLGLDFSSSLELPEDTIGERPVFFYPGSSIGNFAPHDACAFLSRIRQRAAGGGLLIGVDLVKPVEVLEAAYDDALGVTAAFNLNLLRNFNRSFDTDFQTTQWKHVALFDVAQSRIEMHLQAREALRVTWPGGERRFRCGERLHTENSYKYSVSGFETLLRDAGFEATTHWTDSKGWFAVFWASA